MESTSNRVQQWYCTECREWKSKEGVSQCIFPSCSNRNPAVKKEATDYSFVASYGQTK